MHSPAPQLIVLGGPNGAGKTTVAPQLLRDDLAVDEFVNADLIAHRLSDTNPSSVAITAGRMMLTRIDELFRKRVDFAFESTLSSRRLTLFIRDAQRLGYRTHVIFLWLDSADLAVARVQERIRCGGHDVPEATVRRRYSRGLRNFFEIYKPAVDRWRFYDNSHDRPRLVARGGVGSRLEVADGRTWSRARQGA